MAGKNKKSSGSSVLTKTPRTRSLLHIYFILFGVGVVGCYLMAVATDGYGFSSLFCPDAAKKWFSDFFESVRDSAAPDVYTARKVFYPPFSVLLLRCLSYVINSQSFVGTGEISLRIMHNDFALYMLYFLFAVFNILITQKLIELYLRREDLKIEAVVLSYMMVFSYPSIYELERGNTTMLTLALTMFFLLFRDNRNPLVREFSYASLAFASGLKIYPAVFGLLLLFEKRYKDALRLIIYGLLIFVLPAIIICISDHITIIDMLSSVFGNFSNFSDKRHAEFDFSNVDVSDVVILISNLISKRTGNETNEALLSVFLRVAFVITEVMGLCAAYFAPKRWQKAFFLTFLFLNVATLSSSYLLQFVIIPFLLFISGKEKHKPIDWIYFLCFCVFLIPWPSIFATTEDFWRQAFLNKLGVFYVPRLNQLMSVWVYQFMFLLMFVQVTVFFVKKYRESPRRSFIKTVLGWNQEYTYMKTDKKLSAGNVKNGAEK